MAKLASLKLLNWNEMVGSFHAESDRGAAILAGSFAEHSLGAYLRHRIRDKKVAQDLFSPLGPLSSFAHQIAIAYAFNVISRKQHKDLNLIRRIRNHFAHHPLDTTFDTDEVKTLCSSLSMFGETTIRSKRPGFRYRIGYLLTCATACGSFLSTIEIETAPAEASTKRASADSTHESHEDER